MLKRFTAIDVVSLLDAQKLIGQYGSPLYVYRQSIIREKAKRLLTAADGFVISYALKANTNKAIIKIIKESGVNHIDVVSPGQIYKALQCGYSPSNILYTQNFISQDELKYALDKGVTLNIGAFQTLDHFKEKLSGKDIFLRINPKIGAGSSYHVITGGPKSKFGIYEDDIDKTIQVAKANNIHIVGLHLHIGSNMKKADDPIIMKTMKYVFQLLPKFDEVKTLNVGGGLGVAYKDSQIVTSPEQLYSQVRALRDEYSALFKREIIISIEPGRYLVADSSVLLCTITAKKKTSEKVFYGTDTGFNHLIRPALYGSHHEIINLSDPNAQKEIVSVCGNICECTDYLGVDLQLGGKIGDILAIQNAGAYGFAMSSNYNERPKPAEVLIDSNGEHILIRRRETFEDLSQKL